MRYPRLAAVVIAMLCSSNAATRTAEQQPPPRPATPGATPRRDAGREQKGSAVIRGGSSRLIADGPSGAPGDGKLAGTGHRLDPDDQH